MNALLQIEDTFALSEQEKQRHKVTNLNSLNWAFRKLAVIEKKKAEIKAVAQEEIGRIEAWLKKEMTGLEYDESFFNGLIEEYATEQRKVDPTFKASTPYGKVGFHKQRLEWVYDETKLVESLKAAGRTDLIRTKEEPKKDDLKETVEVFDGKVIERTTGTILEGVTVKERPDKIVVEVAR